MTRRRYWSEFRANEFADIDPARTIAILPTAAIEQHGPHLPVGVDALINEGMLGLLAKSAPADLDFRILPLQAIGKSNEHLHAPGTITLPWKIALEAWIEIGLSVARAGVRKIVLVNSHGGNLDLVNILSRELRVRARMLAIKCQWMAFGTPEGMFAEHERRFGIHGGDVETSLMRYLHPALVDMERARNFRSTAELGALPPIGPVSYGWISTDLNPDGVVGDAAAATAAKGEATAKHQVAGFVNLLEEVRAFDLSAFDPQP